MKFWCFSVLNSAILHGFLVKSCGTLIEGNILSSSWLIPSKLFDSVAYWGLNHGLNSCLFRMPLQTQCIQSIVKLSEMSTNWWNTFSPLMPNTVMPLASPILSNILVSCAVLTATVPESQYSYSLARICRSEWLYTSLDVCTYCSQIYHDCAAWYLKARLWQAGVVQQIGFCTLMTQVHMFHYYNYYHLPYWIIYWYNVLKIVVHVV